ncbi:MAG: hypothetical protein ABI743_06960 [bacterium]
MSTALSQHERRQLEPAPWWASILLLMAVLALYPVVTWDLYSVMGGKTPTVAAALWRPGLVYGLTVFADPANNSDQWGSSAGPAWREASSAARAWARVGGARLPLAIALANLLFCGMGLALGTRLATAPPGPVHSWREHFLRQAAWGLTLFPAGYFALASAVGLGYPALIAVQPGPLQIFEAPYALIGLLSVGAGVALGAWLYWIFNAKLPTLHGLTGCDRFTNDPGRMLQNLPQLSGHAAPASDAAANPR